MRRFKGFTLTELMIALAVLGILVAVVTPAVMKARPNRNKMMVKKTFYAIENTVSELINNDVVYPDHRDDCATSTDDPCRWGFDDDSNQNFEGESYSGNKKFANLFRDMLNVKAIDNADDTIFMTNDGASWDLSGTVGAWDHKEKVGKFNNSNSNVVGTNSGVGTIKVIVDGGEEVACKNVEDCNMYEVQILANGKLRIDPQYTKAIEWTSIDTSIRN